MEQLDSKWKDFMKSDEDFFLICREDSIFFKIWQEYETIYMTTYVSLL